MFFCSGFTGGVKDLAGYFEGDRFVAVRKCFKNLFLVHQACTDYLNVFINFKNVFFEIHLYLIARLCEWCVELVYYFCLMMPESETLCLHIVEM
jgi:hypothetical protein